MPIRKPSSKLALFAPGILLAATGVGAGDLLTSTLAGAEAGVAVIWAVVVGALLKWVLTEGLARWQLATGTTLLEGWNDRLGGWMRWLFLTYVTLFSLVVGAALVSACGVAGAAIYPIGDLETSRLAWGTVHSLVGLALIWRGSFAFFERIMSVLVGVMFVTVVGTAAASGPDWGAVARGFIPSMPTTGSVWVLAVLGGVGGTVTLLSYGYWIREQGRSGLADVRRCRLDLALGNGVTALFGIAVIIIGSRLELVGSGSTLALEMAAQLEAVMGPTGKWLFLAGFWGAVFSSVLGVWQSIPYLFADFWFLSRQEKIPAGGLTQTKPYRVYLLAITFVPLLFLGYPVVQIQKFYGVFGAFFLPVLAVTLIILNSREKWVGKEFTTHWSLNAVLGCAVALFLYLAVAS
jgi:Mn2+/Fe2+ NRAMP family transporter